MCSTALVVQPPAVPGADMSAPAAAAATADSKKGGAKGKPAGPDSKAAGAVAAKPRPGKAWKLNLRVALASCSCAYVLCSKHLRVSR
jgi:hypothetical protein